jgi:DNA-binding PadR family transcriptional regulator
VTKEEVPPVNELVGDLGGLAEASVQVLIVLSAGPAHGYAIMAEVERETGRALGPGTMYAALARLEQRGLIEALPAADRRRPYRLTDLGARALEAELSRLEGLASRGRERLRRSGS